MESISMDCLDPKCDFFGQMIEGNRNVEIGTDRLVPAIVLTCPKCFETSTMVMAIHLIDP